MRIEIVEYDATWPQQFAAAAAPVRAILGDAALAVHHIGSTSVPGLPAKDVIDIQVSVAELGDAVVEPMTAAGYEFHDFLADHQPAGASHPPSELAKNTFSQPEGSRRVNIHVRVEGAFNQRYAVLFRDYLRAHAQPRDSYGQIKKTLADWFPEDRGRYYDIKDPAIDMMMAGAFIWAEATGWEVPPSDA